MRVKKAANDNAPKRNRIYAGRLRLRVYGADHDSLVMNTRALRRLPDAARVFAKRNDAKSDGIFAALGFRLSGGLYVLETAGELTFRLSGSKLQGE